MKKTKLIDHIILIVWIIIWRFPMNFLELLHLKYPNCRLLVFYWRWRGSKSGLGLYTETSRFLFGHLVTVWSYDIFPRKFQMVRPAVVTWLHFRCLASGPHLWPFAAPMSYDRDLWCFCWKLLLVFGKSVPSQTMDLLKIVVCA